MGSVLASSAVEEVSAIIEGREAIDREDGSEYFGEEMGVVVVGAVETMERRREGTEAGVTLEMVTKAGRRMHVVGTSERSMGARGVVRPETEGSWSGRGMSEAESMRRWVSR